MSNDLYYKLVIQATLSKITAEYFSQLGAQFSEYVKSAEDRCAGYAKQAMLEGKPIEQFDSDVNKKLEEIKQQQ